MFSRRKGIALVTTLMMLPLMVLLGLSLTGIGVSDLGSTRAVERTKQAVYLSEAGRDEGLRQLLANNSYSAPNGATLTMSSGNATYFCWNNAAGMTALTASNQVQVQPGFAYILSQATVNNITRRSSVLVKLMIPSPYVGAATGLTSVSVGNGYTDSYNSDDWPNPLNGYTNTNNGDVSTNASSSSAVTVGSNGDVNGSINLNANINAPTVTVPNLAAGTVTTVAGVNYYTPGSYGALSLSGQSVASLDASGSQNIYVFDSISMSGQARMQTSGNGKIIIYVRSGGSVSIGGNGFVNSSMKPSKVEIKVAGNGSVSMNGGGNSGAGFSKLYAPQSAVTITGNMHLFGAVVANTIGFSGNSGAGITYDEAGNDDVVIPPTAVNWQRF